MRSHRAIIRDIIEYGLDPTVAHTKVGKDGRLARGPAAYVPPTKVTHVEPIIEAVETPGPALVSLAAQVPLDEQHQEVAKVEAPAPRKGGFQKKDKQAPKKPTTLDELRAEDLSDHVERVTGALQPVQEASDQVNSPS